MISYKSFLVRKLNHHIDIIKNIQLDNTNLNTRKAVIEELIDEIQLNMRPKKVRDNLHNDKLWEDYIEAR